MVKEVINGMNLCRLSQIIIGDQIRDTLEFEVSHVRLCRLCCTGRLCCVDFVFEGCFV